MTENGKISPKDLDDNRSIEIRLKALELKINEEQISPEFVSDKGVVDYPAYWLRWCSENATSEQNNIFRERVISHSGVYNKIIIPEFGRFNIENNEKRETNYNYQKTIHMSIKYLYCKFNLSFIEYSFDLDTTEDKIMADLNLK